MRRAVDLPKTLKILMKTYPDADCALGHSSPLQLLVSTILSAQCTDKRVNQVTPALFKKYKSASDFAGAKPGALEKEIHSTGFFRQKAKWIRQSAAIIDKKYSGKVPRTLEELTSMPGVARKTANVVLGTAYRIAAGIVVDTHVKRLSKRLGFSRNEDPVKVEQDLIKVVPKKNWIWFSHAMILHGRQLCKAITPLCDQCPMNRFCPSSEV